MISLRPFAMAAVLATAGCASGYDSSYNQYPNHPYGGYGAYGYGSSYSDYVDAHNSHRYYRPDRRVICDRAHDICYDQNGFNEEWTERIFGHRPASRHMVHNNNDGGDDDDDGRNFAQRNRQQFWPMNPSGQATSHDNNGKTVSTRMLLPSDRQHFADNDGDGGDHSNRPAALRRPMHPVGQENGNGEPCPPLRCSD